ncbi:MAG: hypothetical protein ABIQ41_03290 [Gemmatimonadales bacterium]
MRIPLLLALVLIVAPAEAQFRLPKPKVPNPLNRATAAAGGPRAPEYDDRVIEIDDARVTALLKGLKLEQDRRPALEAGYKKNADDRAAAEVAMRRQGDASTRWQGCLMQVMGIDTAAQRRLDARIQAAEDRRDGATVQRLQDSVMQAMMVNGPQIALAQAEALKPGGKCGPGPSATPMAAPPRFLPEPSLPLADSLRVLGAGAAGMTPEQYTLMQERVLGYLVTDEAQTARGQGWAFSAGEVRVLHARRAALQPYQQFLADH